MKILYKHAEVAAVFWPVGKLKEGGTCEFSTEQCLEHCCEYYDPSQLKKDVFEYMITKPLLTVSSRIAQEMANMGVSQIHWFASGDCPKKHTTRIVKVIRRLSKLGKIQNGFTRNQRLWEKVNTFKKVRIALTVDTKVEKDKKQTVQHVREAMFKAVGELSEDQGPICVPDYKKGQISLYTSYSKETGRHVMSSCGSSFVSTGTVVKENVCRVCYEETIGCFA